MVQEVASDQVVDSLDTLAQVDIVPAALKHSLGDDNHARGSFPARRLERKAARPEEPRKFEIQAEVDIAWAQELRSERDWLSCWREEESAVGAVVEYMWLEHRRMREAKCTEAVGLEAP